jgi:hypothetical protein
VRSNLTQPGLAVMLYLLGLSYGGLADTLAALGV